MENLTVKRHQNWYAVEIDGELVAALCRTQAAWWVVLDWLPNYAEYFHTFGEAIDYVKIEAAVKKMEVERNDNYHH